MPLFAWTSRSVCARKFYKDFEVGFPANPCNAFFFVGVPLPSRGVYSGVDMSRSGSFSTRFDASATDVGTLLQFTTSEVEAGFWPPKPVAPPNSPPQSPGQRALFKVVPLQTTMAHSHLQAQKRHSGGSTCRQPWYIHS